MARKDNGRDARKQQAPSEPSPARPASDTAPRRRAPQTARPAGTPEVPPNTQRGASRRRKAPASTPPSSETGHTPSTPENPELAIPAGVPSATQAPPVSDEVARELETEPAPVREDLRPLPEADRPPLEPPDAEPEAEPATEPNPVLEDALRAEERAYATSVAPASSRAGRRERQRLPHGNALGILIERHFTDPTSPCRSYSDLERRSGISREALSRYVTARPDRRRSPTIDTLVAIADAMHLSLESVSRAAAASVHGVIPPPEEEQHVREEVLGTLVAGLTDEQFSAVVELLRHLRPAPPTTG